MATLHFNVHTRRFLHADTYHHALYPFRYGTISIVYCDTDVYRLQCSPEDIDLATDTISTRSSFSDLVFREIDSYLAGGRTSFSFAYHLPEVGTPFQKEVWQALLSIPYGTTCTYGELATQIGRPNASRAVGMALHQNPLHLILPCHRVVGADGSLTGYAGGLELKRHLLDIESKHLG